MESKCHKHGCITVKSITNAFHIIIFIVMKLILIVLVLMGGVLARMKVKQEEEHINPPLHLSSWGMWRLWLIWVISCGTKGPHCQCCGLRETNIIIIQMVLMFWLIKPTFAFSLLCNSVGSVPKYFATCQRLVWSKVSSGTMDWLPDQNFQIES